MGPRGSQGVWCKLEPRNGHVKVNLAAVLVVSPLGHFSSLFLSQVVQVHIMQHWAGIAMKQLAGRMEIQKVKKSTPSMPCLHSQGPWNYLVRSASSLKSLTRNDGGLCDGRRKARFGAKSTVPKIAKYDRLYVYPCRYQHLCSSRLQLLQRLSSDCAKRSTKYTTPRSNARA